jgi:dolichol-phosphate mannosyltransferase
MVNKLVISSNSRDNTKKVGNIHTDEVAIDEAGEKFMKITVIIPCYNESESIANVILGFPRKYLEHNHYDLEVLVIDNDSTDNTAEIAKKAGARVIVEPNKGKGNAMRTGFANISADTDYVAMIDGDDTYSSQELLRLIEPLHNNFCDAVMGSRLAGRMHEGAMRTFNRGGNWLYTHMVRIVYRVNVTDVLTGYFAWKKSAIDKLAPHLNSSGFAIEMEMVTKMAKLGCEIYSVPISYNPRSGQTNLRPIHDGSRILKTFAESLRWKPSTMSDLGDE